MPSRLGEGDHHFPPIRLPGSAFVPVRGRPSTRLAGCSSGCVDGDPGLFGLTITTGGEIATGGTGVYAEMGAAVPMFPRNFSRSQPIRVPFPLLMIHLLLPSE